MTGALETLMRAAHANHILTRCENILFINAQYHPDLDQSLARITCVQHFHPYAKTLLSSGYKTFSLLEDALENTKGRPFDGALILLPKNMIAAQYFIAQALAHTPEHAPILCAAANNAGGKRLKSFESSFKLQNVSYISKNKAKASSFKNTAPDSKAIQDAIDTGQLHFLSKINAHTQAGIYGWNKVDRGSSLLTQTLAQQSLHGHGADFGCGYGYLSTALLNTSRINAPQHSIKSLTCIDADARALEACRKNTNSQDVVLHYIWDDLTAPKAPPHGLDFIVMNPPFHQEKKTDMSIGQDFITQAAKALKPNGTLWMVANIHLPYEHVLKHSFATHEILVKDRGFKVIKAIK